MKRKNNRGGRYVPLLLLLVMVMVSGCATVGGSPAATGPGEGAGAASGQATFDFKDIIVPNELQWDRENSMSIKTESFAGGTLKYSGKAEVNSLVEFFTVTMSRNGWKLVGSAKYKNILLAFTKPYKTCTISIFESKYLPATDVHIYVTDDISAREGFRVPFGAETLK